MNAMPYGIVLMFVLVFAVVAFNDWRKRRIAEQAWQNGERPKTRYLNNRTDWRLIAVSITTLLVVAVIGNRWSDFSPELRGTLIAWGVSLKFIAQVAAWIVGVVLAGLVIFLIVFTRFGLAEDPDFIEIKQLAFDGDVETAIDFAHHVLDGPGKQIGTAKHLAALYHLAVLEGMRGNWRETLLLIEQVERFSTSPFLFDATKSLAFWQLGQLEEAEQGLREALRRNPSNAVGLAALGLFLFDTERIAESTIVLKSLDCVMAARFASPREISLTEHFRHVTNARRHLAPEVTLAESDLAMRRLLLASMDGVGFRDWMGPLPGSER